MKIEKVIHDNGNESVGFVCDCGEKLGNIYLQKEVCGCLEGDVGAGNHKDFHLEVGFFNISCSSCGKEIDIEQKWE